MKKWIIKIIISLEYYFAMLTQFIPKKVYVKYQYYKRYRRFPNLKNPTLISEKLQLVKLKKPTNTEILVSNKYHVKEWIKSLGFPNLSIKTIDYQTKLSALKWESYPIPFIVKVTNGSSQQVVCRSKNDIELAKKTFRKISKKKHYIIKREYTYKYLERGYIVEPYLGDNDRLLDDYKVHCFNGNPLFTQINDRRSSSNRMMIDKDFKYYKYPFASGIETIIPIPNKQYLENMMDISKKISQYFDFARIDFYLHQKQIYIGEITLYPMGGYILSHSIELDKEWGSLLKLS